MKPTPLQAAAHKLRVIESYRMAQREALAKEVVGAYLRAALEDEQVIELVHKKMLGAGEAYELGDPEAEAAIQALIDHIADANKMVTDG